MRYRVVIQGNNIFRETSRARAFSLAKKLAAGFSPSSFVVVQGVDAFGTTLLAAWKNVGTSVVRISVK